ncbi:ROK family protein [Thalassiella azotivora]
MDHAISSPRRLREVNARAVLRVAWDVEAVTAADLMGTTGLSRATVHDVCDELLRRGWLLEAADQRQHGGYRLGRPARRWSLASDAGVVVGVDAGVHRVTAVAADLRGNELARHAETVGPTTAAPRRRQVVERSVRSAVERAAPAHDGPLSVVVGVPAPVDADGLTTFRGNPFWRAVNPSLASHLRARGWSVVVDNDANLAATGEATRGLGVGVADHVTLLVDEGFGAGVVVDGRLLRGAHGGVGEMRFLDHVDGVGSPAGVAAQARHLALEALDAPGGPGSVLATLPPRAVDAVAVLAAAQDGDAVAARVVAELAARLTRVVAVLATTFDPSVVVLAGHLAEHCGPLAEAVRRGLPAYLDPPRPVVAISSFGGDGVVRGAVERAVADVRERALSIDLPGAAAATGT